MTKDVEQQRHVETSRRTVEVKRRALELGFDAVGIATLEPSARATEFDRWLSAGYAGTMTYLHRQGEKRQFPARIMADARVAIVTLTNYFHRARGTQGTGKVAQYAWSTDYHLVLGRRLELLATALREIVPGATSRCYVDAGPVPERELAQRAGLGWIGKNTMLIRRSPSSASSSRMPRSMPTCRSRPTAAAAAAPASTHARPPRSSPRASSTPAAASHT